MNLYTLLQQSAHNYPEKTAIVDGEKRISYRELLNEVQRLAKELQAIGVKEKDKIGILFPNSSFYIALTYAIWACGACVVPISVDLAENEVQAIIKSIDLDEVISCKSLSLQGENASRSVSFSCDNSFFYSFIRTTGHEHDDLNMAFLRFTSGTTSNCKGVVLCHETVHERITAANKALKIGPADTIIWLLSMAHHFTVSIVLYLSRGATIIICKNHLAKAILEITNREKGTIIYATPFHCKLLAEDTSTLYLPSVRLAISTAMVLTPEIAKKFYSRFSLPLTQAYGLIEIGLPCINLDDSVTKIDSVGKVLPDYKIKLIDPNNPEVENIKEGEILIKGPGTLDAYYLPWTPRQLIMNDGWFATGDLGHFDEDGSLFITGRTKDLINIAGMKFFPHEVERVLDNHNLVRESYVYPVWHNGVGEVLHAMVVLHEEIQNDQGEIVNNLLDYSRKYLAAYKVPRKIELVRQLPKTFSGKLKRYYGSITNAER